MHDCAQNHSLHTTRNQSLSFYIKPKTDMPQDFERSMKEYFRQKEEFDDKKPHSLTLPPDVRPKEKIQPAPYQPSKINIFTGTCNKSESTYELWRYDI
jgi:hypothetical protein